MKIKSLNLFLLISIVFSYDCNSYNEPTTCIQNDHILCAYCVDSGICDEYNPCDNTFMNNIKNHLRMRNLGKRICQCLHGTVSICFNDKI